MEEKERKEKSEKLFDKGMECYNNQQYKEALKYFEASIKFCKNDRAELFIGVCKNNIPRNENKKDNNSNNNYHKSYSQSNPFSYSSNYSFKNNATSNKFSGKNNNNFTNKSYSTDNIGNDSDDKKCKELLKKKDYYDILNIKKDANKEEIKRGYKKQAIKFHPDKNHSKLAEECFKKISEAYQCLSNPEKKRFYDKYGNEEEFKQKYYQENHKYYQEEMDPFEAFNIFFGNGFYPHRARHYYYSNNNGDGRDGQQMHNRISIFQFLPILLLLLLYLLPSLSFLFESKPLYQFTRNSTYNHKRRTSINGVEFYVGDKFINKYPKMKDFKSLEPTIEKEYLAYLYEDCSNVINYKKRLQYYMTMSYSIYQRNQYKRKIDQLNYNSCQKYNSLVNLIR